MSLLGWKVGGCSDGGDLRRCRLLLVRRRRSLQSCWSLSSSHRDELDEDDEELDDVDD